MCSCVLGGGGSLTEGEEEEGRKDVPRRAAGEKRPEATVPSPPLTLLPSDL